jgi:hypothetical protein
MTELSTDNWQHMWPRAIVPIRRESGVFVWHTRDGGVAWTTGFDEGALISLYSGEPYNVMEAYRRSHAKHDPLLSPHGFFRALPHRQDRAALEFVKQFGPLDWPHEEAVKDEHLGVAAYPFSLDDFWAKHLRYRHVLQLWEARDDESNLRSAFSALFKNLSQINLAEGRKLKDASPSKGGSVNDEIHDRDFAPLLPLQEGIPLPWERAQLPFEDWLRGRSFKELRDAAIQIFHGELNAHRVEARWFRMDVYDPSQPTAFQLHFLGGNLWQRIWELAGLDTSQVKSWRICPGCNTIFYPKRSDQFYCNSREQVLASKRNYINNRRQRERLNKLLETAGDSQERKTARRKRSAAKRSKNR